MVQERDHFGDHRRLEEVVGNDQSNWWATLDIAGLVKPTWEQIDDREYEPWERDRLVVDTAIVGINESTTLIRRAVGG